MKFYVLMQEHSDDLARIIVCFDISVTHRPCADDFIVLRPSRMENLSLKQKYDFLSFMKLTPSPFTVCREKTRTVLHSSRYVQC